MAGVHRCPWPGCKRLVGAGSWGCRPHWHRLPLGLQVLVIRAQLNGETNAPPVDPEWRERVAKWVRENASADKPPRVVRLCDTDLEELERNGFSSS